MNSDISKCAGVFKDKACPDKDSCLRFTIKANDLLQSWLFPKPDAKGTCRDYLRDYRSSRPSQGRNGGSKADRP